MKPAMTVSNLIDKIKELSDTVLQPQNIRIQAGLIVQADTALQEQVDHENTWAFAVEFDDAAETIRILDINDNILYEEDYE